MLDLGSPVIPTVSTWAALYNWMILLFVQVRRYAAPEFRLSPPPAGMASSTLPYHRPLPNRAAGENSSMPPAEDHHQNAYGRRQSEPFQKLKRWPSKVRRTRPSAMYAGSFTDSSYHGQDSSFDACWADSQEDSQDWEAQCALREQQLQHLSQMTSALMCDWVKDDDKQQTFSPRHSLELGIPRDIFDKAIMQEQRINADERFEWQDSDASSVSSSSSSQTITSPWSSTPSTPAHNQASIPFPAKTDSLEHLQEQPRALASAPTTCRFKIKRVPVPAYDGPIDAEYLAYCRPPSPPRPLFVTEL